MEMATNHHPQLTEADSATGVNKQITETLLSPVGVMVVKPITITVTTTTTTKLKIKT